MEPGVWSHKEMARAQDRVNGWGKNQATWSKRLSHMERQARSHAGRNWSQTRVGDRGGWSPTEGSDGKAQGARVRGYLKPYLESDRGGAGDEVFRVWDCSQSWNLRGRKPSWRQSGLKPKLKPNAYEAGDEVREAEGIATNEAGSILVDWLGGWWSPGIKPELGKKTRCNQEPRWSGDRGGMGRRNQCRYFYILGTPGIDTKESIPPAYVAWRAETKALFLLGF